MKKITFWKSFFLLFALIVGSMNVWATDYISYKGNTQDTKTTISTSNVASGSAGKISWSGTSCTYSSNRVNIAANGSITFSAESGNQISKIVMVTGTGDSSYFGTWSSTSGDITKSSDSKTVTIDDINANSVTITTSTAYRCTSTGSIKIYYDAIANVTSLSLKTTPKVNYKVGEKLDLSALVLDADGKDVTSGYTAKIGETTVTSGTTALNTVGTQEITFTYGGKTTDPLTLHVGALQSISLTTTGVKTTYYHNEEAFDPTNLVVTANFSDEEDTPTTWGVELTSSEYSYSPTTTLLSSDNKVTVSYAWPANSEAKTADIPLTVYAVSSLAVTTAPTTTTYRVGDNLDLTGVVITATFDDATTKAITGYTAIPANGAALAANNTAVTFSYAGQSANQDITVGTLDHLTYNSTGEGAFANTSYTEQDKFNPEGLVVNAHFTNGIVNNNISGYTLSPDADTQLTTENDKVTVSYTWAETAKTIDIPITVSDGPQYTVTFSKEGGACETTSLTEADYKAGVTLPTATIDVAGWTFAGWKETSATANTTTRPTLFAAGSTYKPTTDCTLYAVYKLAGIDETKYKRVTELSEATSATTMIFVDNKNSKVLKLNGNDVTYATAPTEDADGMITPSDDIVWSLTGDNTNGYNVKTTSLETNRFVGFVTPGANTNYANIQTYTTTSNNVLWKFVKNTDSDNVFTLRNNTEKTNGSVGSLRFYTTNNTNKWQVYYLAAASYAGNENVALKLYVPVPTAYNSNPLAIITPTVGFEKGGTTLYLDGTTKYTNVATSDPVKSITYSSSDESIATVNASGVVTAVGIGTATITAKVEKELGVSNAAQATYEVVVKNTTTIAGLKAIDNTSGETFSADLTDAVVTYVSGSYAYIQDASAAILVNKAEHGLTAGQKINGAVSGTVKITNSIDQLTAIDVSKATVTNDGVIPTVLTKTVAEVKANAATLDGQLVTITAVTVDKPNTTTTLKDGSKIGEEEATITMYSPNSGASVNDKEKGNFTGYVSNYNGNTPRINLYEQSQFVKTHNAPANQPLEYANATVTLNKHAGFSGETTSQTLTGAKGAVTYEMTGDEIGTINTETGVVTLNGTYGTATIKATAAATEEVVDGVIQPYNATNASYTLTTSQIFEVTFSIMGHDVVKREASAGAGVTAPEVESLSENVFLGWTNAAVNEPTDEAPATIIKSATFDELTNDAKYYALFGKEIVGEDEERTSTFTIKQSSAPSASPYVNNNVSWTWSGVTFANTASAGMPNGAVITFTLPKTGKAKTFTINKTSNSWSTSKVSLALTDKNSTSLETFNDGGSYSFTSSSNTGAFTLTASNTDSKVAYIDNITLVYMAPSIAYNQYTTNPSDKTNIIMEDADGNKVAESIDLSAMTDATALAGVHADEITYTRTMGKLSTLYLPYASTIPDGMTAYEFNGINDAGTALNFNVVEGTTLNAYTPYVLEQEASASKTLSATNVDIAADTNGEIVKGEWTLMGTIARIENADLLAAAGTGTPYIVQSDKKWHPVQANAAVYIPAFRAYFIVSAANGAKVMEMNLGGETTSIDKLDVIDNLDDNAPIFNLAGQKVTKSYKGVVIQNGKKVVNK